MIQNMISLLYKTALTWSCVALVIGLSGCGYHYHTDRELLSMNAERALSGMDNNVRTIKDATIIGKELIPESVRTMVRLQEDNLSRLNEDMDRQIQTANTPSEALREMSADVAGYLMDVLPRDAKTRGIDEYLLSVAMGRLVNTGQDPRLEGALALIRSELLSDKEFTNQFRLLATTRANADEIIAGITGGDDDIWINPGGLPKGLIDSRDVYVVEGRTWIIRDGYREHELHVLTEILCYHPSENDAFASKVIERTYYFHPIENRFLTEEENNNRPQLEEESES